MRRALPNPYFSLPLSLSPAKLLSFVTSCCATFLKQITTILVTKTMVPKNKMMFHKNEMSFYLL